MTVSNANGVLTLAADTDADRLLLQRLREALVGDEPAVRLTTLLEWRERGERHTGRRHDGDRG